MGIEDVVPEEQPFFVEIMDDHTVRIYLGDMGIVFPDLEEVRKLGNRLLEVADAYDRGEL